MNFKLNFRESIYRIICTSLVILPLGVILSSCNQKLSVTPPDAPPPNGFVFINSYPQGFHIYLEGRPRRRATPDSLTWLTTGAYQITLKRNLFRDTSFSINIVEGKKKNVFIDISKDPLMLGSLYCDSKPDSAEIILNDSSTGIQTPATIKNLLPGNYEIRYHLKNHRDDSTSVSVSSENLSSTYMVLVDTTLWQNYDTKNSPILTNNLTCVTVDKNNVVWAGTDTSGVISFDGTNWGGKQIYAVLPSSHVNCITIDNSNMLFIGTNRGFVTYNGASTHMYGFKTSKLSDYWVNAIGFDNAGNWYIGTQGGLTETYLFQDKRVWYTFKFIATPVPYPIITSILKDNSGNLWIGMKNYGIAEEIDSKLIFYSAVNGNIINDDVRAFAESQFGKIWIGYGKIAGSGAGLTYYDNGTWQNVYVLPASSQTNAIYIDKNNTKWIATDQGLVEYTTSSKVTIFNKDNTGLNINDVTGVAQDSQGNLWLSTYGEGLVEYKGDK